MIKQNLLECNQLERSEDEVTARAGLIMFDGFMKAMRIEDIINRQMPVAGSNRGLKAWQYIRPLTLMQYGGGGHIADLRELREDKTLQKATIKMLKMDNNKEYTLWADPTIIDLGDKEYAEKIYTGQEGDRPILAGLKELPIFVYHKYRKGNAMGGVKEAIQSGFETVEAAGKKIKHTACDSEFYSAEVINYLNGKEDSTFTIVADKDVAVKEAIKRISEEQWRPYHDIHGTKTDREIAVTVHAMNGTDAFTLAVLRWKKEQLSLLEPDGYFYHAIATLRWKLVQVAAWIADHSNRIRLKIATTLEKFNHYIRMMKRMEAIAALPY